ncbi:MAG: hypothetical protein N838_26225 [Thiohalocapsa sp. PB-PSB1]|nr:MAG: hypothetical protein N838_26225 [Thiohalocapsa sp. PB-PSB1]
MVDQEWLITAAGVKMPRLIYGTAWKKERTADLVVKAIQSGFKGIDTACQPKHYDERLVGAALRRLKDQGVERDNLFLQTKFTALADQDPRQVPYDKNSPIESQVIQSFEASKNNLQTQYLDSLVLHSPLEPHGLLMRVWDAMETIQGYDADLRNWCANHGVIYQSFWTLTANPHILTSNTVQTIAQKYNRTAPQIFFRYLSQIGIVPLTGTCSEQHMKEDLSIFDFELSSDDLNYVSRIFKQA